MLLTWGEMKDTDTGWLTTREATLLLGIPPRQLYRLIDQGELNAFRVEGDLMVRGDDVARYHSAPEPHGA